jgi:hypothetical protein
MIKSKCLSRIPITSGRWRTSTNRSTSTTTCLGRTWCGCASCLEGVMGFGVFEGRSPWWSNCTSMFWRHCNETFRVLFDFWAIVRPFCKARGLPRLLSGRTRIATRTLEVAPKSTGSWADCIERAEGVAGLDAIILTESRAIELTVFAQPDCSWSQQNSTLKSDICLLISNVTNLVKLSKFRIKAENLQLMFQHLCNVHGLSSIGGNH